MKRRIIAAMLVGPGEGDRYLDAMLTQAEAWADRIVVYPDHVDGKTLEVLERHQAVTIYRLTSSGGDAPSFRQDESFVRNRLMEALDLLARPGDLVVVLDADEELLVAPAEGHAVTVRGLLEILMEDHAHKAWSGVFYHLWSPRGDFYRLDGGWAPAPQFRIYRHEPGARIPQRQMACEAIPSRGPLAHTPLIFAHWGYSAPVDRPVKHRRYMALDAGRFHSLAHIQSIVEAPQVAPFELLVHMSTGTAAPT